MRPAAVLVTATIAAAACASASQRPPRHAAICKLASSTPAPTPAASLDSATKVEVVRGMRAILPKVSDCYQRYRQPGMVMTALVIGPDGHVASACVQGEFAGTESGECIENAIATATFAPSSEISTVYPLMFR